MRIRLRRLERAAQRGERVLRDEEVVAAALIQTWKNEHPLDDEYRISLARELHAGNPDAFAEWEKVRDEENAYVRGRAEEWLSELETRERPRWQRLLAASGGVSGDQSELLGRLSGSRTTMRGGARS